VTSDTSRFQPCPVRTRQHASEREYQSKFFRCVCVPGGGAIKSGVYAVRAAMFQNQADAAAEAAYRDAAEGAPPPFDPSEEYRKLLEIAEPRRARRRPRGGVETVKAATDEGEAYQYLMSRERRVLDSVDRVVNDSVLRDAERGSLLFGMPCHELAMRTLGAVRALFDDLVSSRSIEDVLKAAADPARRPFLGIALVALAVFMGMVHLST